MSERQQIEEGFSFKNYFIPFTNAKAIHWIIIIGLIVFFNGLFNGFIGDDIPQIVQNNTIHAIQNFPYFFTGSTFFNGGTQQLVGIYYRPIVDLTNSAIFNLFGSNASAFHFFSLLLHIINACFIFLVFKYFFKRSIAFVLSLVFLVHPVNSEVVYYISDLQEVLFFFFGIFAFWILQNYSSQRAYATASLSLLFSLFSKETGIVFVIISVFYVLFFKQKSKLTALAIGISPFFLYIPLRIHAIGLFSKLINSSNIASIPLSVRLINIPAMFLYYIKTFLFPLNLAMFYQWTYRDITFNHFYLPLLIDLIFLGAIAAVAYLIYNKFSIKYFKIYLLFALCFLCGIALHMQVVLPLDATVAERWFYVSILGLLGMIGVIFEIFKTNLRRKFALTIFVIIVSLFSWISFMRSFDWRNSLSLATHDITISQDAWNLENLLSNAYQEQGRYKEAKIHAENSIKLYPSMSNYLNLGAIDVDLGNYREAKSAYVKSLSIGEYYQTYENLAFLYMVYGDPKEGINFIKNSALKKFPQDAQLWQALAVVEYKHGDKRSALVDIKQAYYYDPSPQMLEYYKAIESGNIEKMKIKIL